jgi:thiol-disulfide isomerase/thioredoxin
MAMVNTGTVVQVGFILASALAVYGFVSAARNDTRRASCTAMCALGPAYAGNDRKAPDFELPDLDGKPVRLSSYKGKVVFLNFWTKTCKPCLEEMPSLQELAKIARNRNDFAVLTVTIDENPAEARDTLSVILNEPPAFPVLVDAENKIVNGKYGTRLFPETWILDRDGIIRARFDGARDWSASFAIEIGNMVQKPLSCPVEFNAGIPRGKFAALCADDS